MKIKGMRELFKFDGWCVDRVDLTPEESHVYLVRDGRAKLYCPHCGMQMSKSRETPRTARDLPMGISTLVTIHYDAIQGRCRACNHYSTIHPEQISNSELATWRLRLYVARLARHMPLTRIGELLGMHGTTAMRYYHSVLQETVPEPCLDGLEVILIDEKAVHRGHQYVTVVINGRTGEPLYMAEGKKGESLQGFFDQLTDAQKASIKAVGIDRGGAYQKVLNEEIPAADIVFDRFHLVANLNEVLNEIRREAWRNANDEDKQFIKGQQYNLIRFWERSSIEQRAKLSTLLAVNEELNIAYILKEAFRQLWEYVYPKAAENYLRTWVAWAEESAVSQLQRFARGLWRARKGVIAYTRHRVTNGAIESFNNQIARILHRSCGIGSLRMLFLQLREQYLSAA